MQGVGSIHGAVATESRRAESSHPGCAEHTVWTPTPSKVQANTSLSLKSIDPKEYERISSTGAMTFHTTGCTGNEPADGATTFAKAMTAQGGASFLYQLGDITYVDTVDHDQPLMYNRRFLTSFTGYPNQIVGLPATTTARIRKRPRSRSYRPSSPTSAPIPASGRPSGAGTRRTSGRR